MSPVQRTSCYLWKALRRLHRGKRQPRALGQVESPSPCAGSRIQSRAGRRNARLRAAPRVRPGSRGPQSWWPCRRSRSRTWSGVGVHVGLGSLRPTDLHNRQVSSRPSGASWLVREGGRFGESVCSPSLCRRGDTNSISTLGRDWRTRAGAYDARLVSALTSGSDRPSIRITDLSASPGRQQVVARGHLVSV